ncbi:MAG: LysR family transcriptional regulator [Actinomycetota bacterium]|nr:LysR family transcriptional regulator [Actinomycetota bacterium]
MAITLTQLRSFLAVVHSGSVTGAADELVVTQPSVSAAVSALSAEVGAALTEREGRGVRATPAGRAFATYAADVVGLLEQGARAAREAADATAREVRIAAVTTAGEHIVPPLLEAFSERYPDIALSLDVGNRERVFERVRRHRSDIAIGGRPPREGIEGERFLDNPVAIIAAPSDPLAGRASVPIGELEGRPWLLREEGSGTRAMTEEFLSTHGLDPPILTLGSNGAIKQGARAGLGLALQSSLAAVLELELGLLVTLDVAAALPERHWYLLRASRGPLRPPVEKFLAFARSSEGHEAIERVRGPAGRTQAPAAETGSDS